MKSGIYKIVNIITNKQYIGSSVDLGRRRRTHLYALRKGTHDNPILQAAWNKYGENALEFRIIGTCPLERLIELEQEVMDHLKPEYNISKTAGSTIGISCSPETRAKIGMANSNPSIETRIKIGKAAEGRKITEKTRQKMRESHTGNKNHNYGKPPHENTRRAVGESNRRRGIK